jgi:hypothetical protein
MDAKRLASRCARAVLIHARIRRAARVNPLTQVRTACYTVNAWVCFLSLCSVALPEVIVCFRAAFVLVARDHSAGGAGVRVEWWAL